MEKVRTQAERLEQLEGYKNLVEARLSELGHPVPVQAAHLGKPLGGAKPPSQETRLLQVSQENMYLKRRNEKLQCDVDSLRRSNGRPLSPLEVPLKMPEDAGSLRQHCLEL